MKAKDVQVFFGLFPLSYSKLLKEIDPGLSPKNLIKIKAEPEQNVLTKELEDMEKLLVSTHVLPTPSNEAVGLMKVVFTLAAE